MKKGFTLIELLVVVLIIGILTAVAVPQYQKTVIKSRLAQMVIINKAITDAQIRHRLATGAYASGADALDVNVIPPGYVLCRPSPGTAYTDGNDQIYVSPSTWGMGLITQAAACASKNKELLVYTFAPGAVGEENCPANSPTPCSYCGSTTKKGRETCASIGTFSHHGPNNYDYYLISQ